MSLPTMTATSYPTRYVAFDNPGVLVERPAHESAEPWGGFEFAAFKTDWVYAEILSYQGKSIVVHLQYATADRNAHDGKVWRGENIGPFHDYATARKALLTRLELKLRDRSAA